MVQRRPLAPTHIIAPTRVARVYRTYSEECDLRGWPPPLPVRPRRSSVDEDEDEVENGTRGLQQVDESNGLDGPDGQIPFYVPRHPHQHIDGSNDHDVQNPNYVPNKQQPCPSTKRLPNPHLTEAPIIDEEGIADMLPIIDRRKREITCSVVSICAFLGILVWGLIAWHLPRKGRHASPQNETIPDYHLPWPTISRSG